MERGIADSLRVGLVGAADACQVQENRAETAMEQVCNVSHQGGLVNKSHVSGVSRKS